MHRLTLATGGLFLAWLAHDLEEFATMPGRPHPFAARLPWLPESIRREGCSRDQVDVALSLMGGVFAAAAIAGYATRGRSPFYQALLYGYGMHGFVHLGSAVLSRGYTSGAATTLPIVLPFWRFARRALRADGVVPRAHPWTLVAFAPLALLVHGIGYLASRRGGGAA